MDEDLFIESLGLGELCNPRRARVDWLAVQELVLQNPELAKVQCGRNGIFYALNLAICNSAYLAPVKLVEQLIRMNPDALTGDSFDFACGNHHLSMDVMEVILRHKAELLTNWSLRQVSFYRNRNLADFIISNYPDVLPKVCGEWSLIFGNSTQVFWLEAMLRLGSEFVSEEHAVEINMVHYFTTQSNLDAVKMLVGRYPCTLSIARRGRLPIHEAVSNYSGRGYGWNSLLVYFLLEQGYKHSVGEEQGGCGGLFVRDCEGNTPIESAIQLIRYVSFSEELVFGERWECLLVCFQFLYHKSGGHKNDTTFHAALATIPFADDILGLVGKRYEVDISMPNAKGQQCIEIAIEAIAQNSSKKATEGDIACAKRLLASILGEKYKGGGKHLASARDACGNLPLIQALNAGLRWDGGLLEILHAYPLALGEIDSHTGLHPFMISTAREYSELDSSFEMLRLFVNPALSATYA